MLAKTISEFSKTLYMILFFKITQRKQIVNYLISFFSSKNFVISCSTWRWNHWSVNIYLCYCHHSFFSLPLRQTSKRIFSHRILFVWENGLVSLSSSSLCRIRKFMWVRSLVKLGVTNEMLSRICRSQYCPTVFDATRFNKGVGKLSPSNVCIRSKWSLLYDHSFIDTTGWLFFSVL